MSDDEVKPGEVASQIEGDQPQEEPEWWQDPSMPWKHKPGKADIACMAWIGVIGVYGIVMMVVRAWLLGLDTPLLVAISGSRAAIAGLGAMVKIHDYSSWLWIFPMLAGLVMSIKFDWVYWWAGKLWGRGMIEVWAGQSKRAAKNYARAERWAIRWGPLGIFLAYIPIPLPIMAVVFVLAGASGMSWKRFMLLDAASSILWQMAYFGLGFWLGQPVADVLKWYAQISIYVAIGLMVVIVLGYIFKPKPKPEEEVAQG